MEDLKPIIAKNITELRTAKGMTQLELAEKLHYSDKAVSKWERGDSVPEIGTLKAVAELFEVSIDYLVNSEHSGETKGKSGKDVSDGGKLRNRAIITGICILSVCLAAVFAYVLIDIISSKITWHWIFFADAVPLALIVWLIFNSVWFNRRRNYLIISLLVWSLLTVIHLTFLVFGIDVSPVYLLGIPAQIIIIMWSKISFKGK